MKFTFNPAKIISYLLTTSLCFPYSPAPASPAPPAPPTLLSSGTQISLNGQTWSATWSQRQVDAKDKVHTGISDAGVTQVLGVELLNTENPAKQPVKWFSQPTTTPFILDSWLKGGYRYLDVTELAQTAGWQLRTFGNTLLITTPPVRVEAIQSSQQPWGENIVIDLDRPTPWQVTQQSAPTPLKLPSQAGEVKQPPTQAWVITIDASPPAPERASPAPPAPPAPPAAQTILRVNVPDGLSPRVTTLLNPYRLAIDFRADAWPSRDILWAPGLRYRQQFVDLDAARFPVVWLEINLHASGLLLKPIWSDPTTLIGTAPLIQTAQRYAAAAAINGGFFNRHEQLPLGAIRRDGQWLSSPILNRGVIAWNELGQVKVGRLSLQETLTTSLGERLPILAFNSGYVQAGITRYTSDWGPTYTPLNDNEVIAVVQNHQVTAQLSGGNAGKTAFPIPPNGYLLAIRDNHAAVNSLPIGTVINLDTTVPSDFTSYPQILGAGPLLIQNHQIVLDAKAEQFSDAFIKETAPRSAIGITSAGTLLIIAVHNRSVGTGPTLAELARIMQQMGCVDALNLDGGSSTSLYLGGQLLDRSPSTAARIHNGLGVFLR
jgi:hypothetical protein